MKVPGGLEAFTVAAVELAGGVVEQGDDGLHTVLWSEPGSGDVTVRQLTFDPELLDEAPDAEPRIVFAGTLAGKRREAPLALTWDRVERTAEPVRCLRCDGLTYELGLHRGGGIACPRCLHD